MGGKAKGGAQGNLSKGDIVEFEMLIALDIQEQSAIATILSDMDAEIASLEAKLTKARQIKQGMMQELLTGRIRLG
jgi:type I restriction enzyme S subunit